MSVTLSVIYTKTGDDGTTSLGNRQRVSKDHSLICAIGDVDELNSVIGYVMSNSCSHVIDEYTAEILRSIQNDLFDLGADLCVPYDPNNSEQHIRITAEHVTRLEKYIDEYNAELPTLKSFVLPGGSVLASRTHMARAVCRRAERSVISAARDSSISPHIAIYLNRLSDLLFVLARYANIVSSRSDVLWQPLNSNTLDKG